MISKIYSVFDAAANAYMNPFFVQSTGVALRSFSESANDPQSPISRYARDFTLFELGEFDDEHASFTMLKTPKSLGTALEYVVNIDPPGQGNLLQRAEISDGLDTQTQERHEASLLRNPESTDPT